MQSCIKFNTNNIAVNFHKGGGKNVDFLGVLQELAGIGGDVCFVKHTFEFQENFEAFKDWVSIVYIVLVLFDEQTILSAGAQNNAVRAIKNEQSCILSVNFLADIAVI